MLAVWFEFGTSRALGLAPIDREARGQQLKGQEGDLGPCGARLPTKSAAGGPGSSTGSHASHKETRRPKHKGIKGAVLPVAGHTMLGEILPLRSFLTICI